MKTYTEAYDFLIAIMGNVPYGVVATDMSGYITMINEQAYQSLATSLEIKEVIETKITDYLEEIEEVSLSLTNCFRNGRTEINFKEISLQDKFLNIHGKPILNGMLITIDDITETKKAQDNATINLLKGQEIERRRLAREIHDGIGPLMSTIRLNLDGVKNSLINAPTKTQQQVKNMEELIQNVAADIRSISHALMPGSLFDFGVVEALKGFCNKANESEQIQIDFYHAGIKERFNKIIEVNLYRIAQELLHNAIKYAQAKRISVQLVQQKDNIVLTVEDDGIGFDPIQLEEMVKHGIGLSNIHTRVNSLGGTFIIDSQLKEGVFATVEIPLL